MTNLDHIHTLIRHGAEIRQPDGTHFPLTDDFYNKAVEACGRDGYNAICYDLILPDITEPMMLAIHRDGHVDSGSVKNICACLDR